MLSLHSLIRAAETLFHLPEGGLNALDRHQPLASFRHLAMLVAHEGGFNKSEIARAFERDRSTVYSAVDTAKARVNAGVSWWLWARADLVDAWETEREANIQRAEEALARSGVVK